MEGESHKQKTVLPKMTIVVLAKYHYIEKKKEKQEKNLSGKNKQTANQIWSTNWFLWYKYSTWLIQIATMKCFNKWIQKFSVKYGSYCWEACKKKDHSIVTFPWIVKSICKIHSDDYLYLKKITDLRSKKMTLDYNLMF